MRKFWSIAFSVVMLIVSVIFLGMSGLVKLQHLEIPFAKSAFPSLNSIWQTRKGNQALVAQNYQLAFDTYIKALESDPFADEIHLNLGLTYEMQQIAEKAAGSYQNALKYADKPEVKFMALFNEAQMLGKAKKYDEALEKYQAALGIDPTSKEVKTNIELLIQAQQQGGGQGDNKEQKDQQDQQNQDQKDKQQGKDQKDQKDSEGDPNKDQKDQKGPDKDKQEDKKYGKNPKPQPRKFKSEELSEHDVKKILGEIKQQEQKIRSEYNRKDVKEQPRDKDW